MRYIDQLKYECFSEDSDGYLKKAEVVNFDIIHNLCRGTPRKNSDKHYQMVRTSDVKKCHRRRGKKPLVPALDLNVKTYM